jgi:hypothetical protein
MTSRERSADTKRRAKSARKSASDNALPPLSSAWTIPISSDHDDYREAIRPAQRSSLPVSRRVTWDNYRYVRSIPARARLAKDRCIPVHSPLAEDRSISQRALAEHRSRQAVDAQG